MTKAVLLPEPGPPESFTWGDIDVPDPGPGEVQIRQSAVGLNFIDIHFRSGLYSVPQLPAILGREGAGTVEAIGEGVSEVAVGQRVAYAGLHGAYTELRNAPADRLVPLPDHISDDIAAAIMQKGMTAQVLVRRVCDLGPGDTILYHAAAGGVGLIACEWAKHLGATVIGTVGSAHKVPIAAAHGCAAVINYETEDFAERVKDITDGKGVQALYDSVGAKTFEKSLPLLAPQGTAALYGQASGPVPPDVFTRLPPDRFFIRPTLGGFTSTREDLLKTARELFDVIERGGVQVQINQTYALKDAAQAHRDLEARRTTGSTILVP